MNAIQFIESHQSMFFHWLYKTAPKEFPRVCEYASDVLGSWLYHQFPDEQIEVHSGLYDGWSHAWIEVNGQTIVDFTITQFLGGMDQKEEEGLSDELFYERYFLAYQPSPFFYSQLASLYTVEEGLVLCRYDEAKWHLAQGLSFETYLKTVSDFGIRERMYNLLKAKSRMSIFEMQKALGYEAKDSRFTENLNDLIGREVFLLEQDQLIFNGYIDKR